MLSKKIQGLSSGACSLRAIFTGSDKSVFKGRRSVRMRTSKNKFAGVSSKVKAVRRILETNSNSTVIWVDATVHISKLLNLSGQALDGKDFLLARNGVRQRSVNIGVMVMRNTKGMLNILNKAVELIEKYGMWDQAVFNCLLLVNKNCTLGGKDAPNAAYIKWGYLSTQEVTVLKTTHKCQVLKERPAIIKFIGYDRQKMDCMKRYRQMDRQMDRLSQAAL